MNNRAKKPESSGCFGKIISLFLGIFLVVFLLANIYIFVPLLERAVQDNFCKAGTIESERRHRNRKITCVDKKTGEKIDVSISAAIAWCPGACVFVFVFVLLFGLGIMSVRKETRRKAQTDFRNFRS